MPHRRTWLTYLAIVSAGSFLVFRVRSAEPPTQPAPPPPNVGSPAKFYALRLKPGQDLKREILAFAQREGIKAGAVVTCVGSLTDVKLRLANRSDTNSRTGHFEIVSLVGTLDPAGGHLHLSVSDKDGVTFGGHLVDGCVVYTTAEIVLAELTGLEFRREVDPTLGYKELAVYPRK